MTQISEYERKRLENIKHNQQILQSLALPVIPVAMMKADPTEAKGKRRKASIAVKEIEPFVQRKSKRLLQQTSIITEEEINMIKEVPIAPKRPERPKPIAIPLDSQKGATPDFVQLMKEASSFSHRSRTDIKNNTCLLGGARQYRIRNEFCVAKVAEDRIYSMAIHPNSDKIIISAGGKYGSLGFWDATDAWNGTADSRNTFIFNPHSAAITNQIYHPQNWSQLITTSYDGTIRALDIIKGQFDILYSPRDKNEQLISAFDMTPDGSTFYFTDLGGVLTRLDPRIGKVNESDKFQLHEKKAGGLSLSPVNPNLCATSSLDDTICLWDLRKIQPFESDQLARYEYRRAVTSVQFHPRIPEALVSTCYDDHVRIHTNVCGDKAEETAIWHNNQTGRWITLFKAFWDPKSTSTVDESSVIVGNMNRGLDVIKMDGSIVFNSLSDLLTAQPAVNTVHRSLDLIASGTASGKCFLWSRV